MITMMSIGTVHSSRTKTEDDNWDSEHAYIELDASRFSPGSLLGINGFSHVEIVFHMNRVEENQVEYGARLPRNRKDWPKVGIFAQRGKNRPNQIAITICRFLKTDGLKLYVDGLDAIDGTAVLDIKPWVQEFGPRGSIFQPEWITELMQGYWRK